MKLILLLTFYTLCVLAHLGETAAPNCNPTDCTIEADCRCSSVNNPITNPDDPAPQLIAITMSESIVPDLYTNTIGPLFFDKTNPDGAPISLTFFVPHEYTDYSLVQDLWVRGYEIGSHSITKDPNQTYWQLYSEQDLIDEFGGQKQIIATFGNLPPEDITGVRTPQLQLQGDVSIDAYVASELGYDNSWPTQSTQRILPYTLTYASTQQCQVAFKCPVASHPDFWVAPITNIKGSDNTECSSFATCLVTGSASEIADWLVAQTDIARNGNRAPLTLRLDTYWFSFTANSFDGFVEYLNRMASVNDVFFVGAQDIIDWMKNPVPVSQYTTPDHSGREPDCLGINCHLFSLEGVERYMKSCVPCPQHYPWKGNPMGD